MNTGYFDLILFFDVEEKRRIKMKLPKKGEFFALGILSHRRDGPEI